MNIKDYHLKSGTLLDERYQIETVIGEGGFGITYSGFSLHQKDKKIAIKEFYLKDCMDRDCRSSNVVQILREEDEEYCKRQKQRFLKEARTVSDFAQEPGIVRITDYFEENQTAYIVMNYLEGQTLKKYMKTQPPMEAESAFRLMLPLMGTLAKIHSYGIIHRDISPDNLILGPDGKLTLIDFGAAKAYSPTIDQTCSIILKGGYAPCEQYDSRGKLGPWSDIYALCAVIYFCITKHAPDDAFQRMLHDELKSPSELGISISPALERILMKGLSMDIPSRYQHMQDLICDVKEQIREVDPKIIRLRWIKRISFALCILAVLSGIAFWYYQSHLEQFKFHGAETFTMTFGQSHELSDSGYSQAKDILKQRVEILAGEKNYIQSQEKNGDVTYVLPAKTFRSISKKAAEHYVSLNDILKHFLAGAGQLSLSDLDLNTETVKGVQIKKGVLEGFDSEEYADIPENEAYYYLEITLNDKTKKQVQTYLQKYPDDSLTLFRDYTWTTENYYKSSLGSFIYTIYDRDNFQKLCLTSWIQDKSFYELLTYDITHESYESDLAYSYLPPTTWEEVESSMIAGDNQVNEASIEDPAVYLQYTCSPLAELSNGEWYETLADFKILMDTLDVPYAFGISSFQEQDITLKIAKKDLYLEMASLLIQRGGIKLSDLGGASMYLSSSSAGDMIFEEKQPANTWMMKFSDEYDIENLQTCTKTMLDHGRDTLYLTFGGYKLASCKISDVITDGTVELTPAKTARMKTKTLADFLYTMMTEVKSTSNYSADTISYTCADGTLDLDVDIDKDWILENPFLDKIQTEAKSIDPDIEVESSSPEQLTVTLPYEPEQDLISKFTKTVETLYERCNLGNGFYQTIYFQLDTSLLNDREDFYYRFSCYSDYEVSLYVYLGQNRMEKYQDEMEKTLKENSFLHPFTQSEYFEFYSASQES